jgi:hypothetical protein
MGTQRDVTRIVQSWLRTDEHESADRVLDDVLALLDTTPQRRSWWPARRVAPMNALTKLAMAAAGVAAIALIAIIALPRGGSGVGAPIVAPSASQTPSSSPTPPPTIASGSASAATFPPSGPLAAGRYPMTREGIGLSIAIPGPGWTSGQGFFIARGQENTADGAAFIFWPGTPDNVYSEPCKKIPLSPLPPATATDLASAVSKVPGTTLVSGPTDVTVGGFPAKHVVIRIPDAIPCAPSDFQLWYDGDPSTGGRYAQSLGETIHVWIVDKSGTLVWIDAETYKGAVPQRGQELQQIVDSIQFE